MDRFRSTISGNIIFAMALVGLFFLALTSNSYGVEKYDVHFSWFIDMEKYTSSAHGKLHCSQCHQTVVDQESHPTPANIKKVVDGFFQIKQCAGKDCHENTLKDLDGGVHGRIRFDNLQKYQFCIDCHDPHIFESTQTSIDQKVEKMGRELCIYIDGELSKPSADCSKDEDCLACHQQINHDEKLAIVRESNLCFKCHDPNSEIHLGTQKPQIPPLDKVEYQKTDHSEIRCTQCHVKSATFEHQKQVTACTECHLPHEEALTHDSHSNVECQACHLPGKVLSADYLKGKIIWEKEKRSKQSLVTVHNLVTTENNENCIRCHNSDNKIGAAGVILPAKSVICLSCHTATFSVNDTITIITLIVLLLVMAGLFSIWLSGGNRNPIKNEQGLLSRLRNLFFGIVRIVFSKQLLNIIKAIILDAIIQRKLFRGSKLRWLGHSLILYGFLLRIVWGLVALVTSKIYPEWSPVWSMIDKNFPLVAFLFDFTGLMIILGVTTILLRKLFVRKKWSGLPKQEWLSVSIIGSIIVVGFILEGMRLAMTLDSPGKHYAFIGYAISQLFNPSGLTEFYGNIWYLHAFLTGAFIVWLPFSRMFHIVMAPISIAISAVSHHEMHDHQPPIEESEEGS